MNKPRILIIENSVGVTGALVSIVRAAVSLKDYIDFQFVVPLGSEGIPMLKSNGFTSIWELPMREISKRFISLLLYIPFLVMNSIKLRKIINENSITLIHSNDVFNLLPVAIKFLGVSVPYICHVRFMPDRFPQPLFKFWIWLHLRYASAVVAVSQSVLKMLPSHQKCKLIYDQHSNNVSLETQRIDAKQNFRFLYLANWTKGKGHNFALDAFEKINQHLPEWTLRFVGADLGLTKNKRFRDSQIKRIQLFRFSNKIDLSEFTDEVEKEYRDADIVLNFSESESFSITCLDALFYGKPVIATDCGGPAEIIENGKTGIIVPNRNVDEMAAAMIRLANNFELRMKMGMHGRESVREKFGKYRTTYVLKDVYEDVLSK